MPDLRTCKLCLQVNKDLCESHYLPKALFGLSREDGDSPILLSPSLILPTDRQIKARLLCRECEQRFSERGEDYALSMVNRGDRFELLQIVRAAKRYRQEGNQRAYFGNDLPVDRDALAYFALSVIWRGAVRIWHTHGDRATGGLRLGDRHQEALRQYLAGQTGYPKEFAVKITVATDFCTQNSSLFPWQHVDSLLVKIFAFYARGVFFDVGIGENLPHRLRRQCCITSAQKLIFSADCENGSMGVFSGFMRTARIAKRLKP